MYRTFNLTPTTSFLSLWQTLVNAGFIDSLGNILDSSSNKTQAIVPDRVCMLDLVVTTAGTVTLDDTASQISGAASNSGFTLANLTKRATRNSICLKDYQIKGSDGAQNVVMEIESI